MESDSVVVTNILKNVIKTGTRRKKEKRSRGLNQGRSSVSLGYFTIQSNTERRRILKGDQRVECFSFSVSGC